MEYVSVDKPFYNSQNLTACSPLNHYDRRFAATRLKEWANLSIFSIALSHEQSRAKALVKETLNLSWPACGTSTLLDDASMRLLGLQSDQVFAVTHDHTAFAELEKLSPTAFTTDQSDSWVKLQLVGPKAISALERICPLDLHASVFKTGDVARTVMEHLSVIILCQGPNDYFLLSPTSSAQSFLHALEVSLQNVHD